MTSRTKPPLSITGGCLCGSIRYTLTIPEDAEWPPKGNSTCQCTMCRKFTGSPIPQGCNFPTSYISPPFSSQKTYKSFQSAPRSYRSFCSDCGSSLTFNSNDKPEQTEIMLGTLDEEVLCGKKGEDGKREGGLGVELCKANAHIWMENAIPGITDQLEGRKYQQDGDYGERDQE